MNNSDEIINKLNEFISADKFEAYKTLAPDISDSDENTLDDFNELCNDCAGELIATINAGNGSDDTIRKIIYKHYQHLSNDIADTDDWDFAQEIAIILGDITQVNMAPLFQKNFEDKKENFEEVHSLLNDANLTSEQKIGMNYLINKIK